MGSLLEKALAAELATWESAGRRRRLDDGEARGADFVSNDYLGLARHPRVIEAAREALAAYGAGGRAARLLGGGTPLHATAERAVADWLGAEEALLFPSGYQANLGLIGSLAGRGDVLLSDELNHASLIDAARLSRARVLIHRHLDLDELERNLERARAARRRLVVTESVFSMEGDLAPLAALHELCVKHDAWLVVDEAHATGVVGAASESGDLSGGEGAGGWAAAGGADGKRLLARVVTGGKALGVAGAFAVGSALLREQLLHRARAFLFTTSPPPAVAGALVAAIELAREAGELRARARRNALGLAERLALPAPDALIVPVVLGADERALAAAERLQERGLDARPVRPPTVPEGTARLRIVCHAQDDPDALERLGDALAAELDALPAAEPAPPAAPRAGHVVVAGTDTGVGKTLVSALLLRAAARRGKAAYWKPVQTGNESDTAMVARLSGVDTRFEPAVALALPASPHEAAADEGRAIDPAELEPALDAHRRVLGAGGLLVAELAGGLLVPYREDGPLATQLDWLASAAPPVVLVARSGLGTLNHTLLSLEALRARHLEPRALFLAGDPHPSNHATLRRMGRVRRIFEIPIFAVLDPSALDAWLDENDGLSELLAELAG